MTQIQVELSDIIAQDALAAGLLAPQVLERLLSQALARQRAADDLLSMADEVAAAGIEPMSMDDITAEVEATREDLHQRAHRH
jgi:hypothetical protein